MVGPNFMKDIVNNSYLLTFLNGYLAMSEISIVVYPEKKLASNQQTSKTSAQSSLGPTTLTQASILSAVANLVSPKLGYYLGHFEVTTQLVSNLNPHFTPIIRIINFYRNILAYCCDNQ